MVRANLNHALIIKPNAAQATGPPKIFFFFGMSSALHRYLQHKKFSMFVKYKVTYNERLALENFKSRNIVRRDIWDVKYGL